MLKTKKNLLKICLIVLMIMSTILLFTGCGKDNNDNNSQESETAYLQPLKDYFDGIKNKDLAQILKAFPDFMGMADSITEDDIDDLYAQYEALFGANITIDYSLGNATAIEEDELAELEEEIAELYDDIDSIDITAGYTVPVTVTIHGDGLEEDSTESEETDATEEETSDDETTESSDNVEEDEMYVLQYNGNWYIM